MVMSIKDLHTLPKVRDSWSYLYADHCRVEQENHAIAFLDDYGKTPVPAASLSVLLLGPGTTITHAATRALADNGCLVLWTGESGVRMYAQGLGETRSSRNLLRQARLWSNPELRLRVVFNLYQMRFDEILKPGTTLQQVRGKEGARVRAAYAEASRESGVPWHGRRYNSTQWNQTDPINRALSAANSCLYGVCHAAIVSAGYSTALGFIHTGKMLSFVYDIADLYKTDTTIPVAFAMSAESEDRLDSRVRHACRDLFHRERILPRIMEDIDQVFSVASIEDDPSVDQMDEDDSVPADLWDPVEGRVPGSRNWADPPADAATGKEE
jgi:CRISP-associated protein Cas1